MKKLNLKVVIDNDKTEIKLAKSNSAKVVLLKVTGNKMKMDDVCPTFTLKTTVKKFKFLIVIIPQVTSHKMMLQKLIIKILMMNASAITIEQIVMLLKL